MNENQGSLLQPTLEYTIEEKVDFDQFLCDYHKAGSKILVDANWLQDKLRNMYIQENELRKAKKDISTLTSDVNSYKSSLQLLRQKINSLNLSLEIKKYQQEIIPIHIIKVLDITV